MTMYLTPAQVAEKLRMSVGTLNNWRVQGRGPKFVKFGSKVLYPEKELYDFERKSIRVNTAQSKLDR